MYTPRGQGRWQRNWRKVVYWTVIAAVVIAAVAITVKSLGAAAKPAKLGVGAVKKSLGAVLLTNAAVVSKAAISGLTLGGAMGGLSAWAHGGDVWEGIVQGALWGGIMSLAMLCFVSVAKGVKASVGAANARKNHTQAIKARNWYNKQMATIDGRIDKSQSLEMQARQASALRNEIKMQARVMTPKIYRAGLPQIQPFEFYVAKYARQGFVDDDLFKRILLGSETPNTKVNANFGVRR